MASEAIAAVGTLFQRYNLVTEEWITIAEITSITGPGLKKDNIDVTSFDSERGYREFITGFAQGDTIGLTMNFTREMYDLMLEDFVSDEPQSYQILFPDEDESIMQFDGLVEELPMDVVPDDRITSDVTIEITGVVEFFSSCFIFELTIPAPATQITVPFTVGYGYSYNCVVNFGDNTPLKTITMESDPNATHTYAQAGVYTVSVSGLCEGFDVPFWETPGIRQYITGVTNWGLTGFKKFNLAGCINLTSAPPDSLLSFTLAVDLSNFFYLCPITVIPEGIFDNCPLVTILGAAFAGTNISSIPEGLFDNCPLVTNMAGMFSSCLNLVSGIPEDLFKYNIKVTTFANAFAWCTNLTTVPEGLFAYNPLVTTFDSCFKHCWSLTAIPEGLFAGCPAVKNFEQVFNGCNVVTSIPENLFKYNTVVTSFWQAFLACIGITSIPAGLFRYNTIAWKMMEIFSNCTHLVTIPVDLFKYNVNATQFYLLFNNCASVVSIPEDLFKYNSKVVSFNQTFRDTHITAIPANIFTPTNNPLVTDFGATFYNCHALDGNAPALWTMFPGAGGTLCFYNDTGLDNYASIPVGWK